MLVGRPLDDLAGEGAADLAVEAAAEEQEVAAGPQVLHHRRDRRLDVDLRQDFDIVAVGNQIVARRSDSAHRLVEDGAPGIGRRGVCRFVVGAEIADPFTQRLRMAHALDLTPGAA
jgi:hypothetical protein